MHHSMACSAPHWPRMQQEKLYSLSGLESATICRISFSCTWALCSFCSAWNNFGETIGHTQGHSLEIHVQTTNPAEPQRTQTQNMAALTSAGFLSQGNLPDQTFNTWPGFTSYSLLFIEKSVLVLPSDILSDGRNPSNNFQPKMQVAWALIQQKAAGIRIADNSPYPAMQLSCQSNPLSIPRAVWKASCQTSPSWFALLCFREMCSKNWTSHSL